MKTTQIEVIPARKSFDPFIHQKFLNRYKAESFLGSGSFGMVYLANDEIDKTRYYYFRYIKDFINLLTLSSYSKINLSKQKALKIILNSEDALDELNVIVKVNHKNVIKYFDHFVIIKREAEFLCIIMEYCEVRIQ